MNEYNELISNHAPEEDITNKHLTFTLSGQLYGIAIRNVIEIVQMQPVTPMPELPAYAKGIINMRGRVIPVIDINLRFNKPEQEHTDRTCIVIVDIDGTHVGFIVDAVEEVLDIEKELISPPPMLSADLSTRFVIGVARLPETIVLLLNTRLLLSDDMRDALDSVAV